jgi:hypothetical protein
VGYHVGERERDLCIDLCGFNININISNDFDDFYKQSGSICCLNAKQADKKKPLILYVHKW